MTERFSFVTDPHISGTIDLLSEDGDVIETARLVDGHASLEQPEVGRYQIRYSLTAGKASRLETRLLDVLD